MKKTIFSGGIYIEGLRQLRVFGFIALSLYLVIFIAAPLFEYADYLHQMTTHAFYSPTVHAFYPTAVDFETLLGPLMGLPVFVAPVMTLIVFSGFNKRRFSDFYHALPYTRACIFLSFTAAILSWVFGILIIGGSVSLLMHSLFPAVYVLSLAGWADVLFSLIVMILMVVSGVLLGCSFTGTLLSNITATGLVLFLPRLVIYLVTSTIAGKLPFVVENYFMAILSMKFNVLIDFLVKILFYNGNYSLMNNLWCDLYSLFIALIMGVLAAIFFIRRKSETASQSAPQRSIQAGIRIAVTLVFSFIATCILLSDGESSVAILLYILAVLAFFIYELLTTLKWKNLLRIIPTLGIVVLLNLALAGLVNGVTYAAAAFRPDAQDITSVRFVSPEKATAMYSSSEFYRYEELCYAEKAAQKISIDDPEIIAAVANSLEENMNKFDHGIYQRTYHTEIYNQSQEIPTYVERIVAIRTGAVTRYRRIVFTYEAMEKIVQRMAALPEYRETYMTLPPVLSGTENILLNGENVLINSPDSKWDWNAIFTCLQDEINEAGFEKWYKALVFDSNAYDWTDTTITYIANDKALTKVIIPVIRNLTPKTFELLMQMHYESNPEATEGVIRLLKGESVDDLSNRYISINYHYINEAGEQIDNTVPVSDIINNMETNQTLILQSMQELGEQLENTDALPMSDAYIGIYYIDSDYEETGSSHICYLYFPLPEDFNADQWNELALYYDSITESSYYD